MIVTLLSKRASSATNNGLEFRKPKIYFIYLSPKIFDDISHKFVVSSHFITIRRFTNTNYVQYLGKPYTYMVPLLNIVNLQPTLENH